MIETVKVDITINANGDDATVYLTHGVNRRPKGFLIAIKYIKGTLADATDLTITGETSGIPIITVTDAGASNVFYYPRALVNQVADGAQATAGSELIPIVDERIQVVVADGGADASGSIEAILAVNSPY